MPGYFGIKGGFVGIVFLGLSLGLLYIVVNDGLRLVDFFGLPLLFKAFAIRG